MKGGRILNPSDNIIRKISNFIVSLFNVSTKRKEAIYAEIEFGSAPKFNYYLLLLLSALIAAFGLIANSPAVVIGAMLVSPLMMPIFGISLSLVTGDTKLFRESLLSEAGGIVLVVCAAYLIGISPFTFEMTQELLNRTSPNLLDLFVAALAGLAGCMATIDERISPILPGIAISTSLTPPLAACGLCFALGAYDGGAGAFILFLANFLTILFVAGASFIAAGFIKGGFGKHKAVFAKRFALAAISLIAIIFFLTNAMIRLLEEKTAVSVIRKTMLEQLSIQQNLEIREVMLDRSEKGNDLNALVVIDAPKEPTPNDIQEIEESLQKKLGKPINIFVQTRITKSVSSSRDKLIHFYRNADGIKEVSRPGKDVQILNVASQIVRERLEEIPGMQVTDIELRYAKDGKKIIYATIQGPIRPFPGGMKRTEQQIQETLGNPDIRLVSRFIESYEISSDGINAGEMTSSVESPKCRKLQELAKSLIKYQAALFPQAVKAVFIEDKWIVVAEINGPTVMTQKQADTIQATLGKAMKAKVRFMAFSKAEEMLGSQEPGSPASAQ